MLEAVAAATAIVGTTPERLRALVAHVPPQILNRRPQADAWSALECVEHLADAEVLVFARRFRAYLDGAEELPGMEPGPKGRSADELVAAFTRAREQNLQLVGTLTAADLERSSHHPRWGEVTFGTHIQEWAGHDLNHLVQAERAILQPFIVASGPMRPLFEDLDVSP